MYLSGKGSLHVWKRVASYLCLELNKYPELMLMIK